MGSSQEQGESRRGRILAVDDEPRVVRLVSEVLRAVGYEVIAACSASAALEAMALEQPNLVLLDVLLGDDIDGCEVCRRIREFSDVAIIMLTAKATEKDILAGFEAGADDYLTKPFSAKELLARVAAVIRRTGQPAVKTRAVFECGDLHINFARRVVQRGGETISLTRTEFALMQQLAMNVNRVMSHVELLTAVWGAEYRDDVDYLRAYIRYLRRKLEADPANPKYIITSPGVGYVLVCLEEP